MPLRAQRLHVYLHKAAHYAEEKTLETGSMPPHEHESRHVRAVSAELRRGSLSAFIEDVDPPESSVVPHQ